MSKAVLISIRPEWCGKIASGQKTIEIRKTRPKLATPFKVYVYQTIPKWGDIHDRQGRVCCEFTCDWIKEFGMAYDGKYSGINAIHKLSCLGYDDMYDYIGEKYGYGWHISDLVIYDKPKELREFFIILRAGAMWRKYEQKRNNKTTV